MSTVIQYLVTISTYCIFNWECTFWCEHFVYNNLLVRTTLTNILLKVTSNSGVHGWNTGEFMFRCHIVVYVYKSCCWTISKVVFSNL